MKFFYPLMLIAHICAYAGSNSYLDTLKVGMGIEEAHKTKVVWSGRFPLEVVSEDKVLTTDSVVTFKSIYRLQKLALETHFQIYPDSNNSSIVFLKSTSPLPQKLSDRVHGNILASIYQAYGMDVVGTHDYKKKSKLAYLGLSLVNVGAGIAYCDYHSFIYNGSPWIAIGNGAGELISIGFMFSDDGVTKGIGIGMYAFYKLMGLIGLANISAHNQVTASGYKFYF